MYVSLVFCFAVTLRWSWLGVDVGKGIWEQSSGICYGLKALSQMWALSLNSEGWEEVVTGQLWVSIY